VAAPRGRLIPSGDYRAPRQAPGSRQTTTAALGGVLRNRATLHLNRRHSMTDNIRSVLRPRLLAWGAETITVTLLLAQGGQSTACERTAQ
jgi:hypothetical protein